MIYVLMTVFASLVLAAAAAIYFFGWIGAAVVGAAIVSLPWTGRLIASLLMRLFVRQVLGDMAKPLTGAGVTLESLQPADPPAFAHDDDYADDMEEDFGPRDWFRMELTITPDPSIVDQDGNPQQWDPEMIVPFVPSDNGLDDLADPALKICEVAKCELLHGGKWKSNREGYGPTRVRLHVGIPARAERFRFLFCMQTVFGEITLPPRPALSHA